MKLQSKVLLAVIAVALCLVPATAGAAGPDYAPEKPDHPAKEHAPKGHAYGFYCKGESKKHVKGEQGTPFSQCVSAAARANRNDQLTAREACKTLSKKHAKGEQGTPFSVCVKGVAQMRKDKAEEETQS
jgi:hypothetical protein